MLKEMKVFNLSADSQKRISPSILAKGLAVYLNSTLLDLYFRQFSGHTQVNAEDLRALHYPDLETLIRLGEQVTETNLTKMDSEIDNITEQHYRNPLMIQCYTTDALSILTALKLPKKQCNERSALVLLALIDLKPGDSWSQASTPLLGIKAIMKFMVEHYGKQYAENTRETIRKDTIHQFVDAGIAVSNPDQPDRPVNSPKWCYQITPDTLELIRSFGTDSWNAKLVEYLKHRDTLNYILSEYMYTAMSQATYDKLEDGTLVGRIPSCKGVIAFASTLWECDNQLRSTLEDWIIVGLKLGHTLPLINNIDLNKEQIRGPVDTL